jgi:hypothetical protein
LNKLVKGYSKIVSKEFVRSSYLHRISIASKHFLSFQLMYTDAVHTARQHNRLICRHNIDRVYTDEHRQTIFVVLAKHRTAP